MTSTREPLTRETIITAAAALLAQGLAVWGLPLTDAQVRWVQAVIMLAAMAWIIWRVRPKVTPVVDPRDNAGTPLTPDRSAP